MPPSRIQPEDTYAAFHSRETFTSIADRLGICRPTLRRWWIAKFGITAYEQRAASILQTPEELKDQRRKFREAHKEQLRSEKKAWREANLEKVKASQQAHREANQEEYRSYRRKYYAANAEKFRAVSRQYRQENGDIVRQKEKDYYRTHPEKILLKGARQRARRFSVPFGITLEDILKLFPSDGCCPITKEPFEQGDGKVGPRSMSLDRINPSLGYVPGNIAVISHLANTIKSDCTDPEVFRRVARYLETGKLETTCS